MCDQKLADSIRLWDQGPGPHRQEWGAVVSERSQLEGLEPQHNKTARSPVYEKIVSSPWEGYYRDDLPAGPAPGPTLETFLSSLMYGE